MRSFLILILILSAIPAAAWESRLMDPAGNTTGYLQKDRYGSRISDAQGNTKYYIERQGNTGWIRNSDGSTAGYYSDPSVLRPTLGDD